MGEPKYVPAVFGGAYRVLKYDEGMNLYVSYAEVHSAGIAKIIAAKLNEADA